MERGAVREIDEHTERKSEKRVSKKKTQRDRREKEREKKRVEESEGIRQHFFFISGLFTLCII